MGIFVNISHKHDNPRGKRNRVQRRRVPGVHAATLSLPCCSVCRATLSSPVLLGSCEANENEVREGSAEAEPRAR